VEELACLKRWNRTLGLGSLLRELESRLRETPARPPRRRSEEGSLLTRFFTWLTALLRPPWGRRKLRPADIKRRYEEVIQVESERFLRYREAVDQLVAQLRARRDRAGQMAAEIHRLEKERDEALEATRSQVRDLEAAGRGGEEIRRGEAYREGLERFRNAGARLEEVQHDALEVAEETERLEALVEQHKGRLDELAEGLRDLREEAAEKVAELTASQIEEELQDHRSAEGFNEELAALRQQIEAGDATRRAQRELATLEPEAIRRELEASAGGTSTDTFEVLLGLAERESSESPPDRAKTSGRRQDSD
jgi:hypothetical protein